MTTPDPPVPSPADLEARRRDQPATPRPHGYTHGVIAKYAALVTSASEGAVTAFPDLDGQGLDP